METTAVKRYRVGDINWEMKVVIPSKIERARVQLYRIGKAGILNEFWTGPT
jgi:hypothetical protein